MTAFDHPLIALVAIIASTLVVSNNAAEALEKWLVRLNVRPSTLAIADASARGDFSRQLTSEAYRRIFWANNFAGRLKRQAPRSDIDKAWDAYMLTVGDWSANLVNNEESLRQYYGDDKESEFETTIDSGFKTVHTALLELRYARSEPDTSAAIAALAKIDGVNSDVLYFVSRMRPRKPDSVHQRSNER